MTPATPSNPPTDYDYSLSTFLAGRNVACPQCEYNLRDLQGNRCPECGEVLVLRIGVAEPRQGMLIAGLVGLSAVAGFNGLLPVVAVISTFVSHDGPGNIRTWLSLGGGLAISALAIRIWLRRWKKIRRLRTTTKGWLVLGCWSLAAIDIVALLLLTPS